MSSEDRAMIAKIFFREVYGVLRDHLAHGEVCVGDFAGADRLLERAGYQPNAVTHAAVIVALTR